MQTQRHQSASDTKCNVTCVNCGYALTGTAVGGECPECGRPVAESIMQARREGANWYAKASLITGLIAWAGFLPLGILAIYYYRKACQYLHPSQYEENIFFIAHLGFALGAIAVIALFLIVAAVVGLIVAM